MDGFDCEGEAEKARAVLLFGNGPIEFRERVFFTVGFPSGLVFVRSKWWARSCRAVCSTRLLSNCPPRLAISLSVRVGLSCSSARDCLIWSLFYASPGGLMRTI